MVVSVDLTDNELKFLQGIIEQNSKFEQNVKTIEGAMHECIRMAMFDEGEPLAMEEGM